MRQGNPKRAAWLSALLPGLGHVYLGHTALGLTLASAYLVLTFLTLGVRPLHASWGTITILAAFWLGGIHTAYSQCQSDLLGPCQLSLPVNHERAREEIAGAIHQVCATKERIKVFCVGTTSCSWDSFGPLVGSQLKELGHDNVLGCADHPMDSRNLTHYVCSIGPDDFIVVVDACIAEHDDQLGRIQLIPAGIRPGLAMGKDLPRIGNVSVLLNVATLGDIYIANGDASDLDYQRASKRAAEVVAKALDDVLCGRTPPRSRGTASLARQGDIEKHPEWPNEKPARAML